MRISRRDRVALGVGGSALVLYLLIQFVIFPLYDDNKRLRKSITTREDNLLVMHDMREQYHRLAARSSDLDQQLSARPGNFSLFSFLEQKAARADVKKNIAYMKPSDSVDSGSFRQLLVEMKLQAVNLKQLVAFLEQVESPENLVALKRLTVQQNSRRKMTLDVIMQVISIDRANHGDA